MEISYRKREKPSLNFWQLLNMSTGFLGIQCGWILQMANTSAIYEYLGANPEQIPILWLAAPVSGLIAQPIVGYMSDRTWGPLGRRRPYFLVGAILSSIALILMPNSSTLWMAAGLLWILDTSINITMEPYRAFTADILPKKQWNVGFAMQSCFVGAGSVIASVTPWCLNNLLGLASNTNIENTIPITVKISFYIGATIFLLAILWTIISTKEYPPEEEEIEVKKTEKTSKNNQFSLNFLSEILSLIKNMPKTMKQLALVQSFTWLGMFCVFLYFPPAVAHNIFGAVDESFPSYTEGIEWAGICIAVYNGVCFIFSWILPRLAEVTSRKTTHSFCLFCGGMGLIFLLFIQDKYLMLFPIGCFGIAWASILCMPYAMLANNISAKNMGLYMGIFNAFIVIPQIIAALGLGWVMDHFLNNNRLYAVVLGGFSILLASILVNFVDDILSQEKPNLKSLTPETINS